MREARLNPGLTRLRWLIVAGYAIAVAWLSLEPALGRELGSMDKSAHFATYLTFAVVAYIATRNNRQYLLACLLVMLFSIVLEFTQKMVPGRTFSLLDMRANGVGVLAGMSVALLVGRQRTRRLLVFLAPSSSYQLPPASGKPLPAEAGRDGAETP